MKSSALLVLLSLSFITLLYPITTTADVGDTRQVPYIAYPGEFNRTLSGIDVDFYNLTAFETSTYNISLHWSQTNNVNFAIWHNDQIIASDLNISAQDKSLVVSGYDEYTIVASIGEFSYSPQNYLLVIEFVGTAPEGASIESAFLPTTGVYTRNILPYSRQWHNISADPDNVMRFILNHPEDAQIIPYVYNKQGTLLYTDSTRNTTKDIYVTGEDLYTLILFANHKKPLPQSYQLQIIEYIPSDNVTSLPFNTVTLTDTESLISTTTVSDDLISSFPDLIIFIPILVVIYKKGNKVKQW